MSRSTTTRGWPTPKCCPMRTRVERDRVSCGERVAFFARHGIQVQRVMTDNGSAYTSPQAPARLPPARPQATSSPAPTGHAPTAKPSASSRPSHANGPAAGSTPTAPSAPQRSAPGWSTTTTPDPTAASATSHPAVRVEAFGQAGGLVVPVPVKPRWKSTAASGLIAWTAARIPLKPLTVLAWPAGPWLDEKPPRIQNVSDGRVGEEAHAKATLIVAGTPGPPTATRDAVVLEQDDALGAGLAGEREARGRLRDGVVGVGEGSPSCPAARGRAPGYPRHVLGGIELTERHARGEQAGRRRRRGR